MNSDSPSSRPIPISTPNRHRSSSITSSIPGLSTSPTSPVPASLQTPSSFGFPRTTGNVANPTTPASPLAAYFFGGSTTSPAQSKASPGFPFHAKGFSTSTVEDEDSPPAQDMIGHTRRASASTTFRAPPTNERGAGIMRRLSLSNAFQRVSNFPPCFILHRFILHLLARHPWFFSSSTLLSRSSATG